MSSQSCRPAMQHTPDGERIGRPDATGREHAGMKWCRFQSGRTAAYGLVEGAAVVEVAGTPFGSHIYPGDVLWMGTDGATENIKDGDVVEVEIPAIGVLRNPVRRER
jgi:uncharacterized protein DUF2437/fumarylacetoacetase-like protein